MCASALGPDALAGGQLPGHLGPCWLRSALCRVDTLAKRPRLRVLTIKEKETPKKQSLMVTGEVLNDNAVEEELLPIY